MVFRLINDFQNYGNTSTVEQSAHTKEREITVNTNTMATVNLTPLGMELLRSYFFFDPKNFCVLDSNILKMPLWQLMQIFGSHMQNGNKEVPFENNEITISVE